MPDERDRRRPRTPPHGSPALEHERHLEEIERARRADEETPVGMQAIGHRVQRVSGDTSDIRTRVTKLEDSLGDIRVDVVELKASNHNQSTKIAVIDEKLDLIVDETRETRAARLKREERAETRADEEAKFRRERSFKIIAIVGGVIAAITAAITTTILASQ